MKKKISTLNTLGSSNNSSRTREDLDFYQTPAYAVKTLAERFDFKSKNIWEPMAGNGMISKGLAAAGYAVHSTDIVERSYKLDAVLDYFLCNGYNAKGDDFAIVTNPPYEKANEFLIHTMSIVKPKTCCVFLPIRYLEGSKRYSQIYSRFKPSKVFVYAQRLGCFKESDAEAGIVTDKGVGSAVAYMWLCFDRDTWNSQSTKTEIEWIA